MKCTGPLFIEWGLLVGVLLKSIYSFLLSQTCQGASQKVDHKLNMAYPLSSGDQAIGKAYESVLPQDRWQRRSK
jgi:hypothetical protein